MDQPAEIFESNRCRLLGTAYRMLKIRADAEDVLQEAYLRWHEAAERNIESPTGFLITVTTRLCLDRLRRLKKEREQPLETKPQVIDGDYAASPEEQRECAEDLALGFFTVLERLGREERAAFLLREIFDYDYSEVARIVCKSESACRQLTHRARMRLRDGHARFPVEEKCRKQLFEIFRAAIRDGNRLAVGMLIEEVLKRAEKR